MSNYVQTTFFTPKDSLPPSNPAKTIFGAAYDVEFGNISSAIASKYDSSSISAGPIAFALGSAAAPSVTFLGELGTGLYSNVSGDLGSATAGVARLTISGSNGGVIVGTATGGSQGAGTLNAVNLYVNGTAVSVAGATVTSITGTANQIAASASTGAVTLSLSPNVVIPAPGSGVALTVINAGQFATAISARNAGNALEFGHPNTAGYGSSLGAHSAGGASFLAFNAEDGTSANTFKTRGIVGRVFIGDLLGGFSTGRIANANADNQTPTTDLSISASGAVTINTPSSGNTLTATSAANGVAGVFGGSSSSGQSFGVEINAGTTSADYALYVTNQANNTVYARIYGDGGMILGAPTGSTQGTGTLNATGLYINGGPVYSGIPQNSQSANYVTVLADANKHIYHPTTDNNARTFTIAANSSVAYPIGTAITFDNDANVVTLAINTDTLVWLPTGATGSRSIAAQGQGTALKVTATRWHLTGVGIT